MDYDPIIDYLTQLYATKCAELRVENQESLCRRFIETVQARLPEGVLDLSNQNLKPRTIFAVNDLVAYLGRRINTLILDNNPIEDEGAQILTGAFEQLRQYKTISLVSVGLNPDGMMSFLMPYLDHPDIYLQQLCLGSDPAAERRNRFNEQSSKFLGEFACSIKSLQVLDLSNTQLRTTNGICLFKALSRECSLKELLLSNTGVSNQAIRQLCVANSKNVPFIEKLDLSGNATISDEACADLLQFIRLQRHFQHLNLQGCVSLGEGINRIFESLSYSSATLLAQSEAFKKREDQRIEKRLNWLKGLGDGMDNLVSTGKVLQKATLVKESKKEEERDRSQFTTAIRTLDISNIKLTPQMLLQFGNYLADNKSLEILKMDNCGIDFAKRIIIENKETGERKSVADYQLGFDKMCESLAKSPSLQQLFFSKNPVGDEGATSLGLLLNIPTLIRLELGYDKIGNDGIGLLCREFGQRTQVQKLVLAGNNVSDLGAQALITMLNSYPRLQQLDTSLNKISFGLSDKLIQLLKQNIQLSCSEIYEKLQAQVNSLEDQNTELRHIEGEMAHLATQEQEYGKQMALLSANLLAFNIKCEADKAAEDEKLNDLKKQGDAVKVELNAVTHKNAEIQSKIDSDVTVFENMLKKIKDKTNQHTLKLNDVTEQLKEIQADPEIKKLNDDLAKAKHAKDTAQKDALQTLAQLAVIEALLVKEGIIQVAGKEGETKDAKTNKTTARK